VRYFVGFHSRASRYASARAYTTTSLGRHVRGNEIVDALLRFQGRFFIVDYVVSHQIDLGYSRLAGADEDRILARLRTLRSDLIDPTIAVHRGRVVKRTGDGSIIEFRSVVDAVRCAIEVQSGLAERNPGLPPEKSETRRHLPLSRQSEGAVEDLKRGGVCLVEHREPSCCRLPVSSPVMTRRLASRPRAA
jgi:class 3 adenylate cyclase